MDGHRTLRAASVVGHQNLATLWVGKSLKGSMYLPLESRSRAVFVGLGADTGAVDVDWGGIVAGEVVVPGEVDGPVAGVGVAVDVGRC